jgi:hypothetical protein
MAEITDSHLTDDRTLDLTDQAIAEAIACVRVDFQRHGLSAYPMYRAAAGEQPERFSFGRAIVLEPPRIAVGRHVLGTAINRFEGVRGYRYEPNANGLLVRYEADLDLYSLLAMIKASDAMRHRSDYAAWALDIPRAFSSPLAALRGGQLKSSANGGRAE